MSEPNPKKVFVVHGRNSTYRNSLFAFLRSIGLQPIEWSQAVTSTGKGAPFVGEILDVAFNSAQAIVILLTGDDEAKLREPFLKIDDPHYEWNLTPQARPNVLFEAGLALGRNPDRTIFIEIGEIRPFSDIAGRHILRLNNSSERRQEVAMRLQNAGCLVDMTGTDWHSTGDFEQLSEQSVTYPKEETTESPTNESDFIVEAPALDDDEIMILKVLGNYDGTHEQFISEQTGFHVQKVLYHLEKLNRENLTIKSGVYFYLKSRGRSYLVENDLLG